MLDPAVLDHIVEGSLDPDRALLRRIRVERHPLATAPAAPTTTIPQPARPARVVTPPVVTTTSSDECTDAAVPGGSTSSFSEVCDDDGTAGLDEADAFRKFLETNLTLLETTPNAATKQPATKPPRAGVVEDAAKRESPPRRSAARDARKASPVARVDALGGPSCDEAADSGCRPCTGRMSPSWIWCMGGCDYVEDDDDDDDDHLVRPIIDIPAAPAAAVK